jgi:glycosyltransferase involved in cell wall biosynthesis
VPTVSVIVPLYNREQYIGDTLRSILDQTYGDLEVLVIDDGSTDRSAECVRQISDPRVRYFFQENSGRPAVGRNAAFAHASGSYVAYLDDDDLWLPTKLERQVPILEANPSVGMVYAWSVFYDGKHDGAHAGPKRPPPERDIFEALLVEQCFLHIGTVLIRRSIVEQVGGFDERPEYRGVEDYELWIRIARHCGCYFLPEVTTRYRIHPNNLTANRWETLRKWELVVENSCRHFNVPADVRSRALSHLAFERFKLALESDRSNTETLGYLREAADWDPNNAWVSSLLKMTKPGMLPIFRRLYRGRGSALWVRDQIARVRTVARGRMGAGAL